jgi:hypothetical protein
VWNSRCGFRSKSRPGAKLQRSPVKFGYSDARIGSHQDRSTAAMRCRVQTGRLVRRRLSCIVHRTPCRGSAPKTSLAGGRSKRPRRPSPAPVSFFYFLFKFLLSTIFLIYKLRVQLIFMEKVMHTNRSFTEKLCTQVVVREKIYTQVILQVVMHTSCTHKFCSNQTLCLKII